MASSGSRLRLLLNLIDHFFSANSWRSSMRKFLFSALLGAVCLVQTGCVVPIYSSNPDDRVRQMIYVSEGLRHINGIWERAWGLDMPDLQTPYRTHGGVI